MKPDWKTAPSWAQYLAQDHNGGWWWFEMAPRASAIGWISSDIGTRCERATIPGEWRKSLTVRGCGADSPDTESDYQRGYRHGYNRRDAEVQGALL